MEKMQPTGFQHLLKNKRHAPENRRKIHHSNSPKKKLYNNNNNNDNNTMLDTTNINKNTSSHRFVRMLIDAVNKMHDSKITHEKISEYNLALILCHKINALFTVQQTFVDAEKLAQTMYSEEFANCIIDILIEGGDLAYIPGQLLVYLTMNDNCVHYLLKDDIIAVICGVLRVGERRFSTIGITIFRNLADFCNSKVFFASKMRSRTNVLKLMLQRYVNDSNNSINNNVDDDNNSKNKKDSSINIDQTMYSFYNTNIVLEILILIEYIISATTSRSHIDELRDIVQETIIINQQQSIEEEEEEEEQESNRNFNNNNDMSFLNNQEVLQMAYKITKNADNRKHHVTKDVDYEKANKSRRKDGYAAANI